MSNKFRLPPFFGLAMLIVLILYVQAERAEAGIPQSLEQDSTLKTQSENMDKPIQVTCSVEQMAGDDKIVFNYNLKNISDETLHVFDSKRMPYLILENDSTLLVLHGVNPPDPDIDYNFIEIPLTQPIEAQGSIEFKVELNPLFLADHYEKNRAATPFSGSITVKCQVAWGKSPILKSQQHRLSIQYLMDWQTMAEAESLKVEFP